jgi:hypothetical protein
MQLVAYGAQDIYLTGQPQITFFKSVYRRHTNFAVESIQQTINGTASPGSRVSVTVSRNGDLLKNLWIQYNPQSVIGAASSTTVAPDVGHAMLYQLELEIGGQLIDRQYGKWLTVWRDLCNVNPTGSQGAILATGAEPAMNPASYARCSTLYDRMSYNHQGKDSVTASDAPTSAYVPMKFWFCRNPGLALPLIALQYHEVKFNIVFAASSAVLLAGALNLSSVSVYADYIYLDTTERRQFAQNAHEYLIDQLQLQSEAPASTIRLNFNHPVKELVITGQPGSATSTKPLVGGATPGTFVDFPATSSNTLKIVLNGTDRFTERPITYFTRNQVWECHTGYGSVASPDAIAVYSFALRPEEHQPSGTCNFSRIDTAQLKFGSTPDDPMDIYAVNYNVLRIMSGMGGLAYSN